MLKFERVIPYVLYLILLIWSLTDPFFWDTVQLGSKHAHYYFDNDLKFQFLPENIDSGHIPTFGFYLALCWTVFGKSLLVSHLAMLPFIIGIIYYFSKISEIRYAGPLYLLSTLVLISDPTLIAQVCLISPDLPLVCFFLAVLHYHGKGHIAWKSIFLFLLALVSMRGMMLVFCFVVFEFLVEKKQFKQLLTLYFPSVFVVVVFFLLHYISKGWIGFHSDSPWSESFAIENIGQLLRKPVIIIWRLLDFNRWFLFLVGSIIVIKIFKARRKLYLITSELYLLGIITLVFGVVGTFFSGLTAHRYFLPINILVSLYFLRVVSLSEIKLGLKKVLLLTTFLILWVGHLLVYPDHIDQGWDASLAFKPYFSLLEQADNYLVNEKILKSKICTAFPDLAPGKYYYLNEDESAFQSVGSPDCSFVLISNIHNEIEPDDFEDYTLVNEWSSKGVWLRLLKNTKK